MSTRKIHGYCSLCIARCGSVATVEDGRFMRLDPDPSHPTGQALCAKGRAAPELVYSKDRLTMPLRRTRPKGDADPGWVEISWEEALDETASALRRIAHAHGPESIVFGQSSPSTTAIADSAPYVRRLMHALGTPNMAWALDMCGWSRAFATRYAYGYAAVGTGSAGGAMADIENAGCMILWGYNPSSNRLTHATATVAAQKRGMKLIVIDPRRAGLANKADVWLRVRPGTDGALALGLAHVMIRNGWFDRAFVRDWTNAPHLIRSDTHAPLRASDLFPAGDARHFVAWDSAAGRAVAYDPETGRYDGAADDLALEAEVTVNGILCRPVFAHYAAMCAAYSPAEVERICWIPAAHLEETVRLIWQSRPVAYYAWSGHEHHANTTETARAMALFYALTGSFDARGGNVLFPGVPQNGVTGENLSAAKAMAPAIGMETRPLGPAKWNNVSVQDLYTSALEGSPYASRALVDFGSNLLLAFADPVRGRQALAALDFYVHLDLFMNPTAEMADIVLPVASAFEREGLKIGFDISTDAQTMVQLRPAVVPPQGKARPDTDIIFDLAVRLGLGDAFWGGDVDGAYRHQLAPSGVTLEQLRAHPEGVRVPLTAQYAKHALLDAQGHSRGFPTPSRRIEFWSETFRAAGLSPMPDYVEPAVSPAARPDLAARFPLVLTCAKSTVFCQTQHRALPSLRRRAPDPEVELHPDAAAARGIAAGDWIAVETETGGMRARALLNAALDPRIVVGQHGWWQDCDEGGAPGYDPFSPAGSNFNLTVDPAVRDPISGTVSHRANLCQVRLAN
jgi:anaerobic selenocysteine-containing dehydrogenase